MCVFWGNWLGYRMIAFSFTLLIHPSHSPLRRFLFWLLNGVYHSIVFFFVPYLSLYGWTTVDKQVILLGFVVFLWCFLWFFMVFLLCLSFHRILLCSLSQSVWMDNSGQTGKSFLIHPSHSPFSFPLIHPSHSPFSFPHQELGLHAFGLSVGTVAVVTINLKLATETRYWTYVMVLWCL